MVLHYGKVCGIESGSQFFSRGLTVNLSLQVPALCSQPDQWSSCKQELKPRGRMSQRHYIRMIVRLVIGRLVHWSDSETNKQISISNFTSCFFFPAKLQHYLSQLYINLNHII